MTILAAYTPSPQGDAALDRAVEEARAHDAELVVLNVARGEAPLESRRLTDEAAASLTGRLEESGVTFTLRRVLEPDQPVDQILDVASEVGAEMIVIGLRRRSATGKYLFGSTAQQILLRADCAVTAVKASGRRPD